MANCSPGFGSRVSGFLDGVAGARSDSSILLATLAAWVLATLPALEMVQGTEPGSQCVLNLAWMNSYIKPNQ